MSAVRIRSVAYDSNATIEEHAHTDSQVTLFLSGEVKERVENRWQLIEPLDIVVKPAGLAHANQFGVQGARTLQLSIRNEWIDANASVLPGLCVYHVGFCAAITQGVLRLFSALSDGAELTPTQNEALTGLLMNSFMKQPRCAPGRSAPEWLASTFRCVEQEFCGPVLLRELAGRARKHPVSVARAFRAHYGMSVKQCVQQLRVKRAARLLGDRRLAASAISQSCGFSDQSHLSRIFAAYTGVTPIAYRRMLAANLA